MIPKKGSIFGPISSMGQDGQHIFKIGKFIDFSCDVGHNGCNFVLKQIRP